MLRSLSMKSNCRGAWFALAALWASSCSSDVVDAPDTTTIVGRVLDVDAQPLVDAEVSTVPTTQTVLTDADGRFVIEGARFTVSYVVTAMKDGFQAASTVITPSATDTNDVMLSLDVQQVCVPGDRRCAAGGDPAVEVCNALGNGFEAPVPCDTEQTCDPADATCKEAISVTVAPSAFGVVRSEPAGINCGSDCGAEFPAGTTVSLMAIPLARGQFDGWGDDCASSGSEVECELQNLQADQSVSASFSASAYPIAVQRVGNGQGTVTSAPEGIDCGTTCEADFDVDSMVTLTAVAASGAEFERWERNCSSAGSAATCTLTMDSAKNVRARFRQPTYTLTVVRNGGTGAGRVTSSPSGIDCGSGCTADLPQNVQVTLTAEPANGSTFEGWTGPGCSGTLPTCTFTLSSDRTVQARFDGVTVPVTVTKLGGGDGVISSSPGSDIDCGPVCTAPFPPDTEVTLTADPDAVSGFAGWGGDCAAAGTAADCQVTTSAAVNVTATFEPFYLFPLAADGDCVVGLSFDGASPLAHRCGSGGPATVVGPGMYAQVTSRSDPLDTAYIDDDAPVAGVNTGRAMPAPPAVTVELTVRRDGNALDGSGRAVLVSDIDAALPDGGLRLLALDDGAVAVQAWQEGRAVATATAAGVLGVGNWAHVAATVSTTNGLEVFVDGQSRASTPGPLAWTASSSTAWVGAEREGVSSSRHRLNGAVDEVRLSVGERY